MTLEWPTLVTGFASGVAVSVIAAIVSSQVQRHADRKRKREQATFRVYMRLIELDGLYFWVGSQELHNDRPTSETIAKIKDLAWRIADDLRENDDLPHVEEILHILMDEDAYPSAIARHDALGELIKTLGKIANPRYAKEIAAISRRNLQGLGQRLAGHVNNAPGLMEK